MRTSTTARRAASTKNARHGRSEPTPFRRRRRACSLCSADDFGTRCGRPHRPTRCQGRCSALGAALSAILPGSAPSRNPAARATARMWIPAPVVIAHTGMPDRCSAGLSSDASCLRGDEIFERERARSSAVKCLCQGRTVLRDYLPACHRRAALAYAQRVVPVRPWVAGLC